MMEFYKGHSERLNDDYYVYMDENDDYIKGYIKFINSFDPSFKKINKNKIETGTLINVSTVKLIGEGLDVEYKKIEEI